MREVPLNNLDFESMTTNPQWGKDDVSEELKEELKLNNRSLWILLQMYTRDIRLGNLKRISGDLVYCQEYLNFAGDVLTEGYIVSFSTAIRRPISKIETSQADNGFLRRMATTITEDKKFEEVNKRKGILGNFKKAEGVE